MASTGFDWGSMIGPAISAGGALLSGASAGKQNDKDRAQRAYEIALQQQNLARQQLQGAYSQQAASEGGMYQNWLQDQFNRANAVQNARGIGEAQRFEGANALRSALFPALVARANQGIYSPDAGVRAATPTIAGLNLDPAAVQRLMASWSPERTQQSIAQRDMDLQSLAFGQAAPSAYGMTANNPMLGQMGDWQQQQQTIGLGREADMQGRVRNALEQNITGSTNYVEEAQKQLAEAQKAQQAANAKKGGGLLGNILKFAPIALAPFTGGLSLAAQAAIGAGLGAAGGALSGGGLKGTLLGAAGGAAPVGLGKLGGVVASKISNPTLAALAKGGISGAASGPGGMAVGALGGLAQDANLRRNINRGVPGGETGGVPQNLPGQQPDYLPPPSQAQGAFQNVWNPSQRQFNINFGGPNLGTNMNNPYVMNAMGGRR